ncbi:MAG: tRNA (adenosine(37)-N6)-dimethylallyltransferase MiaA [Ignavibacteria bacterium RBG_13_36_8]|nr:MAG: tRNA (adenosine(37)-N6)-dimethylallyltransferase MiaA [Ignavibacteria bacterium RBG_13_36_8]
MQYNLITILGPTAVGKTSLAAKLANHFNGEIISADSRQVYKGLDIGTGKDLEAYTVDGKIIPYHLIDVAQLHEEFNLFLFNRYFYNTFDIIKGKKKIPFLVGGTGLYLHSILKGYEFAEVDFTHERYVELDKLSEENLRRMLRKINPNLHNSTDLFIKDRIIKAVMIAERQDKVETLPKRYIRAFVIGVAMSRDEIKKSITKRLKFRLQNGMIEEIKKLVEEGITFEKLEFWGLEYKYVGKYLKGELNYNDMYQKLNSEIHGFAKRQMTWFRKMEREGIEINWLDGPDFETAKKLIEINFSVFK